MTIAERVDLMTIMAITPLRLTKPDGTIFEVEPNQLVDLEELDALRILAYKPVVATLIDRRTT